MWRKILPALLFIIMLSHAFAQAQAPKILAIVPNKTVLNETELFEITASVVAPSKDINYFWSFGDGSSISGNLPKVYHIFYIDTEQSSKDFNVALTVSNGAGSDTQSITIKVKRSNQTKVRILYPELTAFYAKDRQHILTLAVLDYRGTIVENPLTRCKSISAYIKDANLNLRLGIEGKFDITLNPSHAYNSIEFLRVKATCGLTSIDTNIPIYFEPLSLEISEKPLSDKKIYIGESLGRVAFSIGDYPDGGHVESGTFYAELLSDSGIIQAAQVQIDGNSFYADFNYVFTIEDFKKNFRLRVYGQDAFGNILREHEYEINVLNNNPRFNLELQSPKIYRDATFGIMQKVRFVAELNTDLNIAPENLTVFLNVPELGITRNFERNGSIFSLDFIVPARPLNYTPFEIVALAEGTSYADIESYRITITRNIRIEFLYPSDKEKTPFSEDNRLKVELKYPDGSSLAVDKVRATLVVDGRSQEIVLNRDQNKGYYYFNFSEKFLGEHNIRLDIDDLFLGSKSIACTIEEPLPWPFIITLLIVLSACGIFAYLLIARLRHGSAERKKLLERIAQIEAQMKQNQSALFSRTISVEEYKSRMLLLQNEMDTIEKELRQTRSFWQGISAKLPSVISSLKSFRPKPKVLPKQEKQAKEPEVPKQAFEPQQRPMLREQVVVPEWPKPPPAIGAQFELPEEIVPEIKIKKLEPLPKLEPMARPPEKTIEQEKTLSLPKPPAEKEEVPEAKLAAAKSTAEPQYVPTEEEKELYSKEELETINKLCATLKPAKQKYRPGDIYRALIEEGYKPHVALAVVEKLFDIR